MNIAKDTLAVFLAISCLPIAGIGYLAGIIVYPMRCGFEKAIEHMNRVFDYLLK